MKFSCIICKGQDFSKISPKTRDSENQVVKCKACSHLQLYPLPLRKENEKFYNQDKQTKLLRKKISIGDLAKITSVDTKRRVRLILKSSKPNQTLLDVGTGYGFFLQAAREAGLRPIGLEIGQGRLIIAKEVTKVPIWSFRVNGPNKKRKKFDLITLFHVLEHIDNPIKLCIDLKTYLRENGTLIIEIPNSNHYLTEICKPYRDFYWQRAHISYFTPTTIKNVLKKAGYRKIKISGVQRYTFINSLNWLTFGKPQLKNPSYETQVFRLIDSAYRKFLTGNLKCDTLWIEARV